MGSGYKSKMRRINFFKNVDSSRKPGYRRPVEKSKVSGYILAIGVIAIIY